MRAATDAEAQARLEAKLAACELRAVLPLMSRVKTVRRFRESIVLTTARVRSQETSRCPGGVLRPSGGTGWHKRWPPSCTVAPRSTCCSHTRVRNPLLVL